MSIPLVRIWAAASLVFLAATGLLRAGPVPSYELRPGQVLAYEENLSFAGKDRSKQYRAHWRIWVVGQNDDGGWRLVARKAMETLEAQGSRSPDEIVLFARFDIRPDGDVPLCATLGTSIDPSQVFPHLPANAKQAVAGWAFRDDRDDTTIRFKARAAKKASIFEFEADRRGYRERIYEGTDHRTFQFDRKRGLIARVEVAQNYGAHMQGAGKGTLELTSVTELPPAQLATFRAEMDRYFAAHQEYLALYRKVEKSGDEASALLTQARKLLVDVRAQVTLPEPSAALDFQLRNHDRFASHQAASARRFAKIIGQPAPAWEIKDLRGRTHTLEEYHGKVLVLDFWYRGCGWCMRAMPQVKHIASHYFGQPVAVLGMNNDRNEDDARFVAKEMKLDYPVLRSEELPAKYGVDGFPTLIIIDQHGKVADIHVGYSPQLYEEVTAVVDHLHDGN
jgi:thiol-disulfide isomerase/thioredoxin